MLDFCNRATANSMKNDKCALSEEWMNNSLRQEAISGLKALARRKAPIKTQ